MSLLSRKSQHGWMEEMPNYSYSCRTCQHVTDFHCKYEDRPEQVPCENCGEMAPYKLIPPGIMTHSYADGIGRGSKYKDLKEASKLNVAASRTDNPQEKAELKKEIRKTGYTFEK